MLSTHLAIGDVEQPDEGGDEQRKGIHAVELWYFAIKQRQTYENKDQMGTKDLNRSPPQGDEWLMRDEPADGPTQTVEHADEGNEVQHAKRAELPFVEQQSQAVLCPMRAPPGMAHAEEEEADRSREPVNPSGKRMQRQLTLNGAGAHPHAHDPYPLPGEEVEGAPLLQRDRQMRGSHHGIMDIDPQMELGEQPDDGAAGDDRTPASA